jgi:cell division inhibitor SulA
MAKAIPKFIQIHMPLLPLKLMAQSRLGAFVPPKSKLPHALIEPSALRAAILRFIQMQLPLPPLKLMVQSRRGANQVMPHVLIEPSRVRVAKAFLLE